MLIISVALRIMLGNTYTIISIIYGVSTNLFRFTKVIISSYFLKLHNFCKFMLKILIASLLFKAINSSSFKNYKILIIYFSFKRVLDFHLASSNLKNDYYTFSQLCSNLLKSRAFWF